MQILHHGAEQAAGGAGGVLLGAVLLAALLAAGAWTSWRWVRHRFR